MVDSKELTKLCPPDLPQILRKPPVSGKILVMAPHADDETIGLGGTILLHAQRGDQVDLLVMTNGITGNADNSYTQEEYVALRKNEARAAGKILGVQEFIFWDFPDNHTVTENDLNQIVPAFADLVKKNGYDAVYTPHKDEIHTDHHVSSVIAARAIAGLKNPPLLFAYEVWSPLNAEFVVDVTAVFEEKLRAANEYKSQIALNDITKLFKCLNGYRSILLEKKGEYGEALLRMDLMQ